VLALAAVAVVASLMAASFMSAGAAFADSNSTATSDGGSVSLLVNATVTDANNNGVTDPGDTILYRYVITNTGVTELNSVLLHDNLVNYYPDVISTLLPGQSVQFTADSVYTINTTDAAIGAVTDEPDILGMDTQGNSFQVYAQAVTPVVKTPAPAVPLTNGIQMTVYSTVIDTDGDGASEAGETVEYTFTLTNTGQLDLSMVGIVTPFGPITGPDTLAVGQSATYTATNPYVITADDIAAGQVVIRFDATGFDNTGSSCGDDQTITTPLLVATTPDPEAPTDPVVAPPTEPAAPAVPAAKPAAPAVKPAAKPAAPAKVPAKAPAKVQAATTAEAPAKAQTDAKAATGKASAIAVNATATADVPRADDAPASEVHGYSVKTGGADAPQDIWIGYVIVGGAGLIALALAGPAIKRNHAAKEVTTSER
jgi:hypothetical protein